MRVHRAALLAGGVVVSGVAALACTDQTPTTQEPSTGQTSDLLLAADGGSLAGDSGGVAEDGGPTCVSCIETTCGSELSALQTELKSLRTETRSTIACVVDSQCLGLFFTDRDGGRTAVSDCIASCAEDAGLPALDAAASDVRSLATALESCVDTSCAASCPGARRDHDAQAAPPSFDASAPAFDGGFRPLPPPFFGRR
jgi:hypothetical protein